MEKNTGEGSNGEEARIAEEKQKMKVRKDREKFMKQKRMERALQKKAAEDDEKN